MLNNYLNINIKFKIISLTVYFFLIFFFSNICSQSHYKSIELASNEILSFNYKSADSIIKSLELEYENDYLFTQLKTTYLWWMIISGLDNQEMRDSYYVEAESTVQNIKQYNGPTRNCMWGPLFNSFVSHGYRTRLLSMDNNYFSVINYASKTVKTIDKTLGNEQQCDCYKLTSGLYNYFAQTFRDKSIMYYAALVFFPESNEQKGIRFLKDAASSSNSLISAEASYFLARIFDEKEETYKEALFYYDILSSRYPNNLIYNYYELKTLIKANSSSDTLNKKFQKLQLSLESNDQLTKDQVIYFDQLFQKLQKNI